jgi:signal transduction histidine kinase
MPSRSVLQALLHSRRLSLVVLAASFLCHGMAILLIGPIGEIPGPGLDFLIITCLCAGLAAVGFGVTTISAFRAAHMIRFLLLLVALRLGVWTNLLVPVFLTGPFLLETVLAEGDTGALVFNGIFLAGFLVDLLFRPTPYRGMPTVVALAAFVLAAVPAAALASLLLVYRDRLVKYTAQLARSRGTVRNLFQANASLQRYAHHIESETMEKERNRITRDLHDSVGYALTNVIVMMNAGRLLLKENPAALDELLEKVGNQAEQALATTRQILHKLRDIESVERVGLQAIAHLVKNFEGATEIHVALSLGNLRMSYGRSLDSLLFRLVQEGLTNSFRHGRATSVSIIMRQTNEEIVLRIHDNGLGLPAGEELVEGIGFAGMRERLAEYGGSLHIDGVADGFALSAVIPYRTSGLEQ